MAMSGVNWSQFEIQPEQVAPTAMPVDSPVAEQPDASGIDWSQHEAIPQSQPIQVEQPKVEEESIWDKAKAFAMPTEETVQERRKGVKGIAGEVAGGLVRASAGLEWMIGAGIETVYDAGRIVGREAYKAVTDTPEHEMEPWKQTDYITKSIKQAEQELLEKALPEDRTAIGKVVGRVAEYAAPTAAMTRIFINQGKKLATNPKLLAEAGFKRKFQESMIAASKDPLAANKMEQGISAVMATTGQIAEELGVSKGWQIPIELVTGIMTGTVANNAKSIAAWINKNKPSSLRAVGKDRAAEYLQQVAAEDPEFMTKLNRGLELQEKTGVKMDLGQLSDNPELKDAAKLLELSKPGGSTRLKTALAAQTKKIKEIAPVDVEAQDVGFSALETERAGTVSKLEKTAQQTVDDVIDEIDRVAPLDKITAGETGQAMLDTARDAAETQVNKLYGRVGSPVLGTDEIAKAVAEAKKSPLKNDPYMHELDAEMKSVIEGTVLGKQGERIIDAPVKKIRFRGEGKAPQEITLEQARLLESRLKERIRIANAGGERNKARVLNKMLNGIFKQYETATGVGAKEISKLREAAAASKRYHETFNQGEVLLASKIDVQGMDKITSEGFVRNFIKVNSDSKLARTEEAVDNFYNAYGNMPEAKNWMSNSFGALLKEQFPDIANANPRQIQNFISKHSKFLKKAGIEKRFDTARKAITESQDASMALTMDAKEFKASTIGKFLDSDDPVKFIGKAIGTKQIERVLDSVSRIKNKSRREYIERGIKEMAWDSVLGKMASTKRVAEESLLNTSSLRQVLSNSRYTASLERSIGKKHVRDLNDMLDLADRVAFEFGETTGLPASRVDEKLVEKLMTGLRAAAHGFVRPDLIAVQMGVRGFKSITVKESHKVLREAMQNPEFAKELLKLKTTPEGRAIVKTMFSPIIAVSAGKAAENRNE